MTRRTVEAIVQVTYDEHPDTCDYSSRQFADEIRDGVFETIAMDVSVACVIRSVTGGEEQARDVPPPVPARRIADRPQA